MSFAQELAQSGITPEQFMAQSGATPAALQASFDEQALRIADRGYVLTTGEITKSGTGAELLADEDLVAAYLGAKK